MKHEKILKREDGSRVRITATFDTGSYGRELNWNFNVAHCAKGKRTWIPVADEFNFSMCGKSRDEVRKHISTESLKLVTSQEVEVVMLELWEQLKPNMKDVIA